jgi:hypothetical protein
MEDLLSLEISALDIGLRLYSWNMASRTSWMALTLTCDTSQSGQKRVEVEAETYITMSTVLLSHFLLIIIFFLLFPTPSSSSRWTSLARSSDWHILRVYTIYTDGRVTQAAKEEGKSSDGVAEKSRLDALTLISHGSYLDHVAVHLLHRQLLVCTTNLPLTIQSNPLSTGRNKAE